MSVSSVFMATAKIELITSAKRENCLHRVIVLVFIFAIDKKELLSMSSDTSAPSPSQHAGCHDGL